MTTKQIIAFLGCALLPATAMASDLSCRKPEEPAILRSIEMVGDAVVFDYYETELVDKFTVEYLDCEGNFGISINVRNSGYNAKIARDLLETASNSTVAYTTDQVIEAIEKSGLKAKKGRLDNSVCACWDKVLKMAGKQG